jgi:uncharacterized membrane protein
MRSLTRGIVVLILVSLAGCTYIRKEESSQVEATLAAAGFRMKPADTPERLTKLQAMPQRKIFPQQRDDDVWYFYADAEFCKCLYYGSQEQYARYQQLAFRQKIAQERVEAAEMNEDAAMDWGMWGPFW